MKVLLLIVGLSICAIAEGATMALTLSETQLRRAVLDYLDCDECIEHEYEYVVYLGPQVRTTLEAARDGAPPFETMLVERETRYFERGRFAAALVLGFPLDTANADQLGRIDSMARRYASYIIQGDRDRYRRKAERALGNLSRNSPRFEPWSRTGR